jgi:NAD(P)-dependent dehydrogenase (short-subunit alcohol dehydrogenase family)
MELRMQAAGIDVRNEVYDIHHAYTEEVYDFITNINIRGAFFLSLAAGRYMIEAGRGSQINIDSINSHTPLNRVAVYAMAKAAMSQMTKCLAMEWGPHGVRVNAIGPGFTMTELARPLWESQPEMNQWREANTPARRIGMPDDMVGAAIFLASDAASFVTGQVLYVDGGTTCGLFWPISV